MKFQKQLIFIFSILVGLHVYFSIQVNAQNKEPLIWDMNSLNQIKYDENSFKEVIAIAEQYCSETPVTVTDNQLLFEPNKHYYCSVGQYWWPDPNNNGKYVNRDGEINPESRNYDVTKLEELSRRSRYLSIAYYLTKEKKYYKAFIKQMRAWFIDKSTYMEPNFEYAQVVPGYNNNHGRSTGMIDAYYFNSVIEGIRLVNHTKRIRLRTMRPLQKWFLSFADWADTRHGEAMKKDVFNIGLAYDVLMTNIYLFSRKENKAREYVDEFADNRLLKQISEDGRQLEELKRANAYSYSLYNLTHIIDFCYLVRYWDNNYCKKYSGRIKAAFDYLEQYNDNPEAFPYQQKSSWESCRNQFYEQLGRYEALTSKE